METDYRRSDLLALALPACARCDGTGLYTGLVCRCVDRQVFRIVLRRYHDVMMGEDSVAPISLENTGKGPRGLRRPGRPNQDFLADVYLMAKRTLDSLEFSVFTYHCLQEADWKLCCARLKLTKGEFFHVLYRAEAKLGRVFRTTEPYPLFPLAHYFQGTVRGRTTTTIAIDARVRAMTPAPLRPPLAALPKAA